MKLSARQIEGFLAKPPKEICATLIYGPDSGLVSERAKKLSSHVVPDVTDPFNVIVFSSADLQEDPVRLNDEAFGQSLMGGNRLIRINHAEENIATTLKDYIASPSDHSFIVVTAGDLGPKSALRKLFEGDARAAALPCYVESEGDIMKVAHEQCRHAGYTLDRDAAQALSGLLVGNRQIARQEIDKLILYKGYADGYAGPDGDPVRQPMGVISVDDVMESCGDVRSQSLDDLVHATGLGRYDQAQQILRRLLDDEIAAIVILRSLMNHFNRLAEVLMRQSEEGLSLKQAMDKLNPRVFFKWENDFQRQLQLWSPQNLKAVRDNLVQTEVEIKSTGSRPDLLCERSIYAIALRQFD